MKKKPLLSQEQAESKKAFLDGAKQAGLSLAVSGGPSPNRKARTLAPFEQALMCLLDSVRHVCSTEVGDRPPLSCVPRRTTH